MVCTSLGSLLRPPVFKSEGEPGTVIAAARLEVSAIFCPQRHHDVT